MGGHPVRHIVRARPRISTRSSTRSRSSPSGPTTWTSRVGTTTSTRPSWRLATSRSPRQRASRTSRPTSSAPRWGRPVSKPSRRRSSRDQAGVYNTNDDAVSALKAGQIDGIVVDLPTGYFVTAAQVEGSKIVGQFPTEGTPEQFGMVLPKGSALTSCVSRRLTRCGQTGRSGSSKSSGWPGRRRRSSSRRHHGGGDRRSRILRRRWRGRSAAIAAVSTVVFVGIVACSSSPARDGTTSRSASSRDVFKKCSPTCSSRSGQRSSSSSSPRRSSWSGARAGSAGACRDPCSSRSAPWRSSTPTSSAASRPCCSSTCWASGHRPSRLQGVPDQPVLLGASSR